MFCALMIGYMAIIIAITIPLGYYHIYIEPTITRACGKTGASAINVIFYMVYSYCFAWVISRAAFACFPRMFEHNNDAIEVSDI